MKKRLLQLWRWFKPPAKIQLLQDQDGFYVVKAYGLLLSDTLTTNYEKAKEFYNAALEKSNFKFTVIAESKN